MGKCKSVRKKKRKGFYEIKTFQPKTALHLPTLLHQLFVQDKFAQQHHTFNITYINI